MNKVVLLGRLTRDPELRYTSSSIATRVAVSGRIQTRSYDGNDGQKRYVTEVVADDATIVDWNGAQGASGAGAPYPPDDNAPPAGFTSVDDIDDEVPF